MSLSTIAAIVLFYVFLMFLVHELFRKFFRMLLFISSILVIIALAYLMVRGS